MILECIGNAYFLNDFLFISDMHYNNYTYHFKIHSHITITD